MTTPKQGQPHPHIKHERMFVEADPERKTHVTHGGMGYDLVENGPALGALYGGSRASVKQIQVTFDCAEPERVARFWCEVLGYVVPPPPEGFATWDDFDRALPPEHQGSAFACVDPSGVGPQLFFQRVPEGKVVKNRVHLDVRVGTGLVGEERLAALRLNAHDWSRSARYACDYCLPMATTSRAS